MMRIASASSTRWARLAPRRRRVTREEIKGSSGWGLASETRYVYDGMRVIQERTSNGVPTVAYTRGPDLSGTLEGAGGSLAERGWNPQRGACQTPGKGLTKLIRHADAPQMLQSTGNPADWYAYPNTDESALGLALGRRRSALNPPERPPNLAGLSLLGSGFR